MNSINVAPPAVGHRWLGHGGIYAGVARGCDGAPDYHLIVAEAEANGMTWKAAVDWATALSCDEIADFTLPTRHEQALLFANVEDLFEGALYWSRTQDAGDEQYAWYQHFYDGNQGAYHKSALLRARAVRRQPIE